MGPSWSYVEPAWGHIGRSRGHLGAMLGPCWAILGPSWSHVGPQLGHLGAHLGPSWRNVGAREYPPIFPESACEGFFVKKQPLYYIFTPSHLLILHLHTLTPADLHLHTSHLQIYIFIPHICRSTSSHPHTCRSTSSHLHIC